MMVLSSFFQRRLILCLWLCDHLFLSLKYSFIYLTIVKWEPATVCIISSAWDWGYKDQLDLVFSDSICKCPKPLNTGHPRMCLSSYGNTEGDPVRLSVGPDFWIESWRTSSTHPDGINRESWAREEQHLLFPPVSSVQSLSRVQLFATPWIAAR